MCLIQIYIPKQRNRVMQHVQRWSRWKRWMNIPIAIFTSMNKYLQPLVMFQYVGTCYQSIAREKWRNIKDFFVLDANSSEKRVGCFFCRKHGVARWNHLVVCSFLIYCIHYTCVYYIHWLINSTSIAEELIRGGMFFLILFHIEVSYGIRLSHMVQTGINI